MISNSPKKDLCIEICHITILTNIEKIKIGMNLYLEKNIQGIMIKEVTVIQ